MNVETYNKIRGIKEYIDIFKCDPYYPIEELRKMITEYNIMIKKCDHDIPNDKLYVNSNERCPICGNFVKRYSSISTFKLKYKWRM